MSEIESYYTSATPRFSFDPKLMFFKTLSLAFVVVISSALVGWLGGHIYGRIRSAWALSEFARISSQTGINEDKANPELISTLRNAAQYNQDRPGLKLELARNYLMRAEFSEQPAPFKAEAVKEAESYWVSISSRLKKHSLSPDNNADAFYMKFQYANILAMAGEESRAITAFQELEKSTDTALSEQSAWLKATFYNTYAYILLTLEDESLRNNKKGLELIEKCIKIPGSTEEPAYLDTLALAYLKNGNPAAALKAQKTALAKAANADSLYEYIERWDNINAALK